MDLGTNRWAVVVGGVCALMAAGCGGDGGQPTGGGTTTTDSSTGTGGTTTDSTTTSTTTTGEGGTGGTTTGGGGTGGEPTGGGGTGGTGAAGGSGGTGGQGGGPVVNCGDGLKDPGEQCDGADLGGKSCVDFGYSNPAGLICGMDCTFKTGGCLPTCNGAKLEPGEVCDGAFLGNVSCQDFGFQNPSGLACVNCQPDPSGCSAECGNGVLEQGELCDGANLGGKSCQDYGFGNPAGLACGADCVSYSTAGCTAACNGILEQGETCDGAFLNGKTCLDFGYGNAAGLMCINCAYDTSGCFATCGNGVTEPGEQCDDGDTIASDGCGSNCQFTLSGATCASIISLKLGLGTKVLNHTTVGGGQRTATSCASSGPDRVFAITPQVAGFLTASLVRTNTTFDSVLYVSTSCLNGMNTEHVCADSKDPNSVLVLQGGEVVSFKVAIDEKHYFFVDGPTSADAGSFQLVVNLSTGDTCADPIPIPVEPGTPMVIRGSTSGMPHDANGTCGGSGGDVVYRLTRSSAGPLSVLADAAMTNYNSLLHARSICNSNNTELACVNVPGTSGEVLTLPSVQANTPVFLWADGQGGQGAASQGSYGLVVTP